MLEIQKSHWKILELHEQRRRLCLICGPTRRRYSERKKQADLEQAYSPFSFYTSGESQGYLQKKTNTSNLFFSLVCFVYFPSVFFLLFPRLPLRKINGLLEVEKLQGLWEMARTIGEKESTLVWVFSRWGEKPSFKVMRER